MKILKTIENALAKKELKVGHPAIATIRQDVMKKSLDRGEFHKIILAYSHSDDSIYDIDNKVSSKESVLQKYDYGMKPECWVQPTTKIIDDVECYEVSISFHSNLAYDVYIPKCEEKKL